MGRRADHHRLSCITAPILVFPARHVEIKPTVRQGLALKTDSTIFQKQHI
jgi:hypothetical protein